MNILDQTKKKMNGTIDHFKEELKRIRTGRANPASLDSVSVEVYGSHMKIRELGTVTAPEPRMLLISPFDATTIHAIAKGIEKANIGMQPIVDGNVVRLKVPEMDSSVRQEMVKVIKRKCEEAKVSIRNIRRECNDDMRKQKADGNIAEDELKRSEKQIQEQTDKFCKMADDLANEKEKEVLTI